MKWKDTVNGKEEDAEQSDPYYEDDGYVSFTEKTLKRASILGEDSILRQKWAIVGIALACAVVIGVVLISLFTDPSESARIDELEQKISQLERRLEKFDGVDEKVTRIWEQAKAFEAFKTRFDRSEASMSLRMDHLAMSLDGLEKKTDKTKNSIEKLKKSSAKISTPTKKATAKKSVPQKTHTVAAGDTLYNISRRHSLSVDELKSINHLKTGAVIHIGQKLIVSK